MKRYSRNKNSTKIFLAVTIVAALLFGISYHFSNTEETGEVVAKVGNEKIFKSEIDQKLRGIFDGQTQEIKIPEIENMPKEVIEILVKEIYFDKELAKAAKTSKASNNPETQAKISEAKNKILRQAYIDSIVKAEVTNEKVNDKYVELTNELAGKKEYSISHIVVKTKAEAEKILKSLKGKKAIKFSDAAKKYSLDSESSAKGGELGYVLEDNIIKEISDAISKLKKDEVSEPIQTKFGWHLIKFSDVRDAKPLAFEAVKDNIRAQLIQDKINEINSKIIKDVKVEILVKLKDPEEKAIEEKSSEEKSAQGMEGGASEAAQAAEVELENGDASKNKKDKE